MAQVVRESVAQYLLQGGVEPSVPSDAEARALDPIELVGRDPHDTVHTDLSIRLDDYLYGPVRDGTEIKG